MILKKNEDMIRSCDNTVIADFKNTIDEMVMIIFLGMPTKHELRFESKDTSTDILMKLNNGIIDMKSINSLGALLVKLYGKRLVNVQQKLFELASQ